MDDEVENPAEALNTAMGLAYHWGILRIPQDKQVVITDFVFVLDEIKEVGVAMTLERDPGASVMVITDNAFLSCTLTGIADALIGIAHDVCRADTQPGPVD